MGKPYKDDVEKAGNSEFNLHSVGNTKTDDHSSETKLLFGYNIRHIEKYDKGGLKI